MNPPIRFVFGTLVVAFCICLLVTILLSLKG